MKLATRSDWFQGHRRARGGRGRAVRRQVCQSGRNSAIVVQPDGSASFRTCVAVVKKPILNLRVRHMTARAKAPTISPFSRRRSFLLLSGRIAIQPSRVSHCNATRHHLACEEFEKAFVRQSLPSRTPLSRVFVVSWPSRQVTCVSGQAKAMDRDSLIAIGKASLKVFREQRKLESQIIEASPHAASGADESASADAGVPEERTAQAVQTNEVSTPSNLSCG